MGVPLVTLITLIILISLITLNLNNPNNPKSPNKPNSPNNPNNPNNPDNSVGLRAYNCPQANGTRALNTFMKYLYASRMFVEGRSKDIILASGTHLLQASARLAVLSTERREHRFPITPKHHMLYHIVSTFRWQVDLCGAGLSPVCESCAIDEDFVGHLARISRCASPRLACLRTVQRYLLWCQEVWEALAKSVEAPA